MLAKLSAQVFERGWLSANGILFEDSPGHFSLIDTGAAVHAAQTLALVTHAVANGRLVRIVNTHLHSDHCGGNAALLAHWQCEVGVPARSRVAVDTWSAASLSFEYTGQSCSRFVAHSSIADGDSLLLGGHRWQAVAAPGHDHLALMFFEAQTGVLLAGDALWEERLAVIFPELSLEAGFSQTSATLDRIESLSPAWVVPGHGAPFSGVQNAIRSSRDRLHRFVESPRAHSYYAARSLIMFHMLQRRDELLVDLRDYVGHTPVFSDIAGLVGLTTNQLLEESLRRLEADGLILRGAANIKC